MTNKHKLEQSEIVGQEKFDHKLFSEQIARIYGVDVFIVSYGRATTSTVRTSRITGEIRVEQPIKNLYITQDIGALMELAIRNKIDVEQFEGLVDFVRATFKDEFTEKHTEFEYYKNHNNDPIEATRVAIARALITKATQSLDQQTCSAIKKGGD